MPKPTRKRPRHGFAKNSPHPPPLPRSKHYDSFFLEAQAVLAQSGKKTDSEEIKAEVLRTYRICSVFYKLYKDKPKKNDIRRTIEDIRNGLQEQKENLLTLDWFTLVALKNGGFFHHTDLDLEEYIKDLYSDRDLHPKEKPYPKYLQSLDSLIAACDIAINGLRKADSSATPMGASFKQEIAGFCLLTFEHFRPAEASSHREGPFFQFVRAIYGMMEDDEKEIDRLDDAIKKALSPD